MNRKLVSAVDPTCELSGVIDDQPIGGASPAGASPHATGCTSVTSRVWYRAALCDASITASPLPIIRKQFADALGAAGWPDGACLFLSRSHRQRGRAHQDANVAGEELFFSPVAIAMVPHLVVVVGAQPSPPPDRAGATLLIGRETDWVLLPYRIH